MKKDLCGGVTKGRRDRCNVGGERPVFVFFPDHQPRLFLNSSALIFTRINSFVCAGQLRRERPAAEVGWWVTTLKR